MNIKIEDALKGLPNELLVRFNKMNNTARQYTLNRILGFSKVDSIKNAGSMATSGSSLSSTAQSLEERNPAINDIIEYANAHNIDKQLLSDENKFAKEVQAKEDQLAHAVSVMSPTMAESVNFYRRIANGSIKTYKTTETYGADGKLISRKRETIDDVDAKMRAREKLDRLLGINAIQNLGQVQVGSISINIVDASKKEDDDERQVDFQEDAIVTDETIIEQEPVVEVEKAPKPTRKEVREQMDKDLDVAYEQMMKKRAEREAKRKQK